MRGALTCTRSNASSTVIARRVCADNGQQDATRTTHATRSFIRGSYSYNSNMDKDFEVVILSACRTPIGALGGAFKDVTAVDLGTVVIREAIARAGVQPADIGDVVMGCVLQGGAGMNVARQAALKAGVPVEVPGETVNRVCGSGLQAVVHAVEAIRVGYVDTMLAGGMESMSNAPYLLKGARWGYRMGNAETVDEMLLDGLTCAMG